MDGLFCYWSMQMKVEKLIAGVLVLIFSAPGCFGGEEAFPYRLSGVVFAGDEGSIAIIEMADGKEKLFREGDRIGQERIVEIGEKQVRLVGEAGESVLVLQGSPALSFPDSGEVPLSGGIPSFEKKVEQLERRLTDIEEKKARDEAARTLLNSMLGLPPDALITKVNDRPVESPSEVVTRLEKILEKGDPSPVAFTVDGVAGTDRVYRYPENEEQPESR